MKQFIVEQSNAEFLATTRVLVSPLTAEHVTLGIDVFLMENFSPRKKVPEESKGTIMAIPHCGLSGARTLLN